MTGYCEDCGEHCLDCICGKSEHPHDLIDTIKSLIHTCVKALDASDEKDVRETLFFVMLPLIDELRNGIK